MAPGATTHANDMQQRHVELRITPTSDGANLIAPPNANVAPPGWYMLFALSSAGKPSIASWIQLGAGSAPPPPPPPPPPAACGDGADNDGDGKNDYPADGGCSTATDTDERGANLLANTGFESDANGDGRPDSWTSQSRFTRSSALKLAGSYSGRHFATDNVSYTVEQIVDGISAGKSYRYAGNVNIPATGDTFTLNLQMRWLDSSGTMIGTTKTIKSYTAGTGGWTLAEGSLVAPSGATAASIRMSITSLNATIYADEWAFGLT